MFCETCFYKECLLKTKNIFLCILGDERRALFTKNNARQKIECVNLYLTYP